MKNKLLNIVPVVIAVVGSVSIIKTIKDTHNMLMHAHDFHDPKIGH